MSGIFTFTRRSDLLRKTLATMLSGILILTVSGLLSVQAKTGKESQQVEKTRAGIQKLGVGQDARVEIKLRDNTKLKGYISEAGAETFTVTDLKTGASQTVAYPQVKQIKGNNLSTRTKVIIGAAIAAGIGIVLYIVRGAFCDGLCV